MAQLYPYPNITEYFKNTLLIQLTLATNKFNFTLISGTSETLKSLLNATKVQQFL